MVRIRSKKFNQQLEALEQFFNASNTSLELFEKQEFNCSYISKSIWDDINIDEFIQNITPYTNTRNFLKHTITSPITEKHILVERQKGLTYMNTITTPTILTPEIDATIEWVLSLKGDVKNYILDTLYPRAWLFKCLYWNQTVLDSYQLYRSYLSPVTQMTYPISIVFGPYFYIRNKLKWNIELKTYLYLISESIQWIYNHVKINIKQLAILCIYIGVYIYSIYVLIDITNQVRKYRNCILKRMRQIDVAIRTFQIILKRIPFDFWKHYEPSINRATLMKSYKHTAHTFYQLWKYPSKRSYLIDIFKVMHIYEGLRKVAKLLRHDWCKPTYNETSTYMGNMKHPLLGHAVANPIYMKRHLIVTGPNAAGKTTYVKSLLWNILLGQSFGIVNASYGNIKLYNAILHHDRVKDIIGSQSLFETEMFKIQEVLDTTRQYQNSIYFMDEPLHSTPPLDGAAMLKALMVYLATINESKSSIQMILTTHYFTLQELEKEYPKYFKNVCMEATLINHKFNFSYQLRAGFSKQSIGIELLKTNAFPEELIETAIKMKNKIYDLQLNV